MKQKSTISVLVTTYNAERFIRGCLESVKWADEIIVVDMFSNDRTIEIARKYSAKIIQSNEKNHEARTNIGIDAATSDWILKVNVTERITKMLRDEIKDKINSKVDYAGYCVPRRNYFFGRFIEESPGPLYLFKKGEERYPCICGHERIPIKGKVGHLENFKIHYSALTIKDIIEKGNSYTSNDVKAVFAGNPYAFYCKIPVRRASLFNLSYRTFWGFFGFYIVGKGYRYGMHGFITAAISAFFNFVEIAKLWELQYKKEHNIQDELIPNETEFIK